MAKSTFGKVALKDRIADRVRQVVVLGIAGGGLFGVGYYNYGDVKTVEGTIERFSFDERVTGEDGKTTGNYVLETSKGTLELGPSWIHFQSEEDAENLYRKINYGRTYEFRIADRDFFGIGGERMIIGAREITEEELKRRAEEKAKREAEAKQRAAGQPPAGAASQPGAVIQGQTPQPAQVTYNVPAQQVPVPAGYIQMNVNSPDGRHTVQIALPAEFGIAASRIVVTGITPVQPPAPVVVTPAPAPKP